MTTNTAKPQPYDKLNLSPVEATIWQRTTANGEVFYTAQVIRKYKDDEGFKSTPSYGLREADKFIQAAEWVKGRLTVLNRKAVV